MELYEALYSFNVFVKGFIYDRNLRLLINVLAQPAAAADSVTSQLESMTSWWAWPGDPVTQLLTARDDDDDAGAE